MNTAWTSPSSVTQSCRSCGDRLEQVLVDLGMSPLCQTVIRPEAAEVGEVFYPLRAMVCQTCWLVQVGDYVAPQQIFDDTYPYFASYSDSWLAHARAYVEAMVERLGLDADSRVVEVGSNDGYMLQYMVQRGIPSLGVDPTANTAAAAREKGVDTRVDFFGLSVARELVADGWQADLVAGKNVMAQVPDLRDFVAGLAHLVAPTGTVTIEFPHLMTMIDGREFDTIYHEHFSYFSLVAVQDVYARHGLTVTDVEELPTHGGSLRVYAQRTDGNPVVAPSVDALLARERAAGVDTPAYYEGYADAVAKVRHDLVSFLEQARQDGLHVVGYGAPGKGNTLLNHAAIRSDLLNYLVDRSPAKHGHLAPGSRIPILHPDVLAETRPDVILVMPWNLREEISAQLEYTREWGARLMVAIPELTTL
ncbi:class I SAM-dependent methyltransferase [Euzebya rosea]|uniref:class I SAM-dependent methyltransferase n=1 Tax=Euzebya rosea TaxID=2052804 RepID=UPI00196B3E65|nr:class I SAM-dependent methyltransferase [Euzebya rosea]